MPTTSRSGCPLARPFSVSTNSRPNEKISSAYRNATRPASVRIRLRPRRAKSFSPRTSSSLWIWPLMVGWARRSSLLAFTMLPSLATTQKY